MMTNTKHTKKVYNKYAEHYHEGLKKENVWHKYLEKPAIVKLLKSNISNKKVLDLGCGSGPFVKRLYSYGAKKVVGLDLSEELIKIAKKENPEFDFYVGDAQNTGFKNKEFHVVTSSLTMHYIKDLNKVFSEVSRILKNKGIFVFSMHHPVMEISERMKKGGKKIK